MPLAFKSTFIDLDGPVHFADFGGSGEPLLLLHGLGGSHINWIAAAPLLAARYRVLALDLVGFGRSPLEKRSASVEANQAMLDRFLREYLQRPVLLVGNSMGGLIALLQAGQNPKSVAGVALVNAAMPHPSTWSIDPQVLALFAAMTMPGVGELFMWLKGELRSAEQSVEEMLAMCCADQSRVAREVFQAHVTLTREHARDPWVNRAYLQATRSLVRLLLGRDRYRDIVKRVKARTLVIAGAHDRLIRLNAAEQIARLRPDWAFVPLAHVGHLPHIEDPEGFCEILGAWLEGAPALRGDGLVDGHPPSLGDNPLQRSS